MSTTFNGTTGITYPDGSTQASAQVGMKNRLIDAGFIINQRTYVSGTALAAGAYAHDRWKAGSGGGTYTFTQGSLGVPIGITITAGTIVQVIEGCNMGEGGAYTLSWTGTAQARINGGSYASSPITVTGLTAGANCTVEVGTGTFSYPQLEKGSTATSFDYRPYGTELQLCQRYYQKGFGLMVGGVYNGNFARMSGSCKVTMRSAPTVTLSANCIIDFSGVRAETLPLATYASVDGDSFQITFGNSANSYSTGQVAANSSSNVQASAEL